MIIPLRIKDNLFSFIYPLSFVVWICFLLCIPAFIVAIVLTNYVYSGTFQWEAAASSVIRSALSERRGIKKTSPKLFHQIFLVLVWSWMMVILISSYKGNLLAMICSHDRNLQPKIHTPIIKWGVWGQDSLFAPYAKSSPRPTMRMLIDRAALCPDITCSAEMQQDEEFAVIMEKTFALQTISKDFTKTGICNYYKAVGEIIFRTDQNFAFQVRK